MGDDLSKRRTQESLKINVHEPWELKYWTNKFRVTEAALKAAVAKVGVGAKAVEDYLKKK